MLDRKQLKARAKVTFKRNYWKSVLVSLLFALLVSGGTVGNMTYSFGDDGNAVTEEMQITEKDIQKLDLTDEAYEDEESSPDDETELEEDVQELYEKASENPAVGITAAVIFIIVFLVIFCVIMALVIVLDAFICNPIEVGCDRFFLKNLGEQAQVKETAFAFDNQYKNVVNVMFFRDLYTFLWTLLFIIPGIVKSYEYQMIPYLLAEHPDMTKEQAFAESKRMMTGQKWRAFVLDLSFLGWRILSIVTMGILDIFYVQPYVNAAHAALYEALRYGNPAGNMMNGGNFYEAPVQPEFVNPNGMNQQ